MFLSTVGKRLAFIFATIQTNLKISIEYHWNFLIQIFAALFIDAGFFLVWIMFFKQFGQVNGWQLADSMLLQSILWLALTLNGIFAGGISLLARTIMQGELDYYLLCPQPILLHVSVNRTDLTYIGTAIVAIVLFFLSGPASLLKIILYLVVTILSAIIIYNFFLLTQSLAFFLGNFEDAAEIFARMLIDLAYYPPTIYGHFKIVTMTLIPSFFITTLPVKLIKEFNLLSFLILIGFAVLSHILARFVFYKGLKYYESGNLINIRM